MCVCVYRYEKDNTGKFVCFLPLPLLSFSELAQSNRYEILQCCLKSLYFTFQSSAVVPFNLEVELASFQR